MTALLDVAVVIGTFLAGRLFQWTRDAKRAMAVRPQRQERR